VNWTKLAKKQVIPPFVPGVNKILILGYMWKPRLSKINVKFNTKRDKLISGYASSNSISSGII
jgi:hypothetical protein